MTSQAAHLLETLTSAIIYIVSIYRGVIIDGMTSIVIINRMELQILWYLYFFLFVCY